MPRLVASVLAAHGSQGIASARELARAGVTRSQLSRAVAAGEVVRVRPRVYALAPLPALPLHLVTELGPAPAYVARVRAACLGLDAAAAGRTAAALRGWGLLVEPSRSLDLVTPHARSRPPAAGRREKVTRRRDCAVEQLTPLPFLRPLWVTTAAQTAIDCALTLSELEAVVACDSALRSGQVGLDELQEAAARLPGVRDAHLARHVLTLCDATCGSVLESVLRLRMLRAGVRGFSTQRVIRGRAGGHVARVDFCFETQRVVVEVDGRRWHQDVTRDREIDNALARLGWRVLRYTWSDVMHEPERVLAEIREALGATERTHLDPTRCRPAA